MAKNETRRLKPSVLQADRDSFAALKSTTGYAPANSNYAVDAIQTLEDQLGAAQSDEVQKLAAAAAARDNAHGKGMGVPQRDTRREGSGRGPVWPRLEPGAGRRPQEEVGIQTAVTKEEDLEDFVSLSC